MNRRLLILAALSALTLTVSAADSFAGCGGSRRGYHRPARPVVVRHVRHIQHVPQVRPVVIHPRVAAPKLARRLPTVPAGSMLTLPANFLGNQPGSVLMVFNNVKLPVPIEQWTNNGVTIKLPPMAIRKPVVIRLDIVLPHGKLGLTQRVNVTPPAPVVLHPTAPASPLPTQPAIQAAAPRQIGVAPAAQPPIALPVQAAAPNPVAMGTPGQPIVLPSPNAAPSQIQAGTPGQPIVLPSPNAAPSQIQAGTPGQPIVLPSPNAAPSQVQAGTPGQPIVLPSPNAAPSQVQAGTPGQPIVLPSPNAAPSQVQAGTPSQPIVLPPASSPETTGPASTPEVDPFENNPILNELQTTEDSSPKPATSGTAASFFTMIGNVLAQ